MWCNWNTNGYHLRRCVPQAVAEGPIDDIVEELPSPALGSSVHGHGRRRLPAETMTRAGV